MLCFCPPPPCSCEFPAPPQFIAEPAVELVTCVLPEADHFRDIFRHILPAIRAPSASALSAALFALLPPGLSADSLPAMHLQQNTCCHHSRAPCSRQAHQAFQTPAPLKFPHYLQSPQGPASCHCTSPKRPLHGAIQI